MLFIDVLFREDVRKTDKLYVYSVPDVLQRNIQIGQYVNVPFGKGNKFKIAVVVSIKKSLEEGISLSKIKSINNIVDPIPVLNSEQMELIDFLKRNYLCTSGDAISLMVPSVVGKRTLHKETFLKINDEEQVRMLLANNEFRSINHVHILEYLLGVEEESQEEIIRQVKVNRQQIKRLIDKGLIVEKKKDVFGNRKKKSVAAFLNKKEDVADHFKNVHTLNQSQKKAYEVISDAFDFNSKGDVKVKDKFFLLHGITGSGKTEVYLHLVDDVIKNGGNVLYLVPEISLTPQTISWITGRFSVEAAIIHSGLTDIEKYNEWNKIRNGEARIVIAARSGIFTPINNLSLIIIDEEHDTSYVSDSFPRYSAIDVAIARAKKNNATLVLGSATPDVKMYYYAKQKYFKLVEINERANKEATLPEVVIVDMKEQIKVGAGNILSYPLRQAMINQISMGKQAMLFLNRRGYSRSLCCVDCGETVNCPSCSVALTLHSYKHSDVKQLICHYCGYMIPVKEAVCDCCGNKKLRRVGLGTEQLEEMLKKAFPDEKILRMDQDTTMMKGSHEKILEAFRNHEASILIGTQMIAKGHDFPDVTVVGIIGADLMVNSANYHSSERAFQLITQASGRAGRSGDKGMVFLQTYNKEDKLIKYASTQNYNAFYSSEIEYREQMQLPPFKAIAQIMLSLNNEDDVLIKAKQIYDYVDRYCDFQDVKYQFEVFGPIPASIYELRGQYRMNISIKAINKASIIAVYRQVMKDFDSNVYPISLIFE